MSHKRLQGRTTRVQKPFITIRFSDKDQIMFSHNGAVWYPANFGVMGKKKLRRVLVEFIRTD